MNFQIFLFTAGIYLTTLVKTEMSPHKVHSNLKEIGTSTVNTLITFKSELSSSFIIQSFSTQRFTNRADRISQMVATLQKTAQESQKSVQNFLSTNGIQHQVIWLTNQLLVKNVNSSIIDHLSIFKEIDLISADVSIPLEEAKDLTLQQGRKENGTIEWGVQRVRSEEALNFLISLGITPAPVVVATIDTGVLATHEALRDSYYGDAYGWFDPYELQPTPEDLNGHGTHVTGIMVGNRGIGVYPGAKYMACRGCHTASCDGSALLLCGQFITCPTLPDMSQPDCSKAPTIVNNSWSSSGGGESWYDVVIQAWHVAGIIPVFAAGNSGPLCGTANSPGDRNVIGVGSTAGDERISDFSSRGPTVEGEMKPDVSAPGQLILSAYNENDTSYATASGTSMATPHASGVIAIMKALNPSLTYEEVKSHLQNGVDIHTLVSNGTVCGNTPDNQFPNNIFGHGRINTFKSVLSIYTSSPPITSTSTATEEEQENSAKIMHFSSLLLIVTSFFIIRFIY